MYGKILASNTTKSSKEIILRSLSGNTDTNCLNDTDLAGGSVAALSFSCIGDYNSYLDSNKQCNDDTKYFTLTSPNNPPCENCHSICFTEVSAVKKGLCFGNQTKECTCDISEGDFWLTKTGTDILCDKITNTDLVAYKPITIDALKASTSQEYTLEMWVYVYAYNGNSIVFTDYDIIWDKHSRITLYNKSNSLIVKCYSVSEIDKIADYTEFSEKVMSYYSWNFIKCGADWLAKKYFLNTALQDIQITAPTIASTSKLRLALDTAKISNFGFLFIRELKLWQQFNYKYIDTSRIEIHDNKIKYPGLMHLFRFNFNNSTIVDNLDGKNHLIERRIDFIGYNIVDPDAKGLYTDLLLCQEGKIYDQNSKICSPSTVDTKECEFAANSNNDCILCPENKKYLDPESGKCKAVCKTKWVWIR